MVLYLQMDGVDDYLKTPSITFNKMTIDYLMNDPQPQSRYALLDVRTGGTGIFDSAYTTGGNYFTDGKTYGGMSQFPIGVRRFLDINLTSITTDNANVFSWNDGTKNSKGNIYSIKFYNGTTLVAHYDMTTGTVQDQSGNGNHATLTGGTWLDDGTGGTPTGTDGSSVFSTSQKFYSDEAVSYISKQVIFQDDYTNFNSKQFIYEDTFTPFATQQEIFNDGQIGSVIYPLLLQIYMDEGINLSTQQLLFESGVSQYNTTQSMYENNHVYHSTKQIIYSDSFVQYDSIQKIYSDISSGYITKQLIYDNNTLTLNTLQQLFEHSSMNLQTKQSIYHLDTVELRTLQSIYEDNSISMDTLQQFLSDYVEYRQVFKYLLGINRQNNFELGIVGNQKFGVDISDRVIKYNLNVSDQVKKYDLNI